VLPYLGLRHLGVKSTYRTTYVMFVRSFVRNLVYFFPKNSPAFSKQLPVGGVVQKLFSLLMYREAVLRHCVKGPIHCKLN
jgi:hypothetical protein